MINEGAGWSPWVVFGFNPSDVGAVRSGAMGGNESYNKEMRKKRESDTAAVIGDEGGNSVGDTYGTAAANNDDNDGRVSAAMNEELVKAKMITAEMEAEIKDLKDELQRIKEEMVNVHETHHENLKSEELRYSKEFSTQADLVHELQKTNNELLWSNRELQDRVKSMMDGNEYEMFTDKLQESNAIIIALREENERLSDIVEHIQDAATLESCGTCADGKPSSSIRPSEVDIIRVVQSMAMEMKAVTCETEKLGLCPSFSFQSGTGTAERSNTNNDNKTISECVVELGRLMAEAQSSETATLEEISSLRDELLSAQINVDSLQNERDNAVCELRKVTETLEHSQQETEQAQIALHDSEVLFQQHAVAYKEKLEGQLSITREELEATRVEIDSYVSQFKTMKDSRATTELELSTAMAEVESTRESMNACVSELNMLKHVQATAENIHAIYKQTLDEFGDLKNRYSAVMAEAVEYRLQADSTEAELRRQVEMTKAVSEEKWGTAYKDLERQMQHQKEMDSQRLAELQHQKDEDNVQFTGLLQSKEESHLHLSELLHQKEQHNLRFTNLIMEKELQLSELREQKDKDNLQFSDLLRQKEEGCTDLTESLQQKEEDRARLAELLQQKEEDYSELSELVMKKNESLSHFKHVDEDNHRLTNLLHERKTEILKICESLKQKEQDYIEVSDTLAKVQGNESKEILELRCCLSELGVRLKECDGQLFLSRRETIEAEQNSMRSYEQWTRAYEDLQSAFVASEEREHAVIHEMKAKLDQNTVDLDTAKEMVLDREEQLRIAEEGSARMLENEAMLDSTKAEMSNYLARIEELTSDCNAYVEQLDSLKRECCLLGEKNAQLETDLLKVKEGGIEVRHPLNGDIENELKRQVETLSVEIENIQAANDSILRERDQEIAELNKALEDVRVVIPDGSGAVIAANNSFQGEGTADSLGGTCGDHTNDINRENSALRSQISSMELQIDSLGIQVDIQTKNMEDMLAAHFEENHLLELEIEELKEACSHAARNNNNLEGGAENHSSSMKSIKDVEERSEIMSRASNLQHEAKRLGQELSEAREESERLRAVILRVLELVGHHSDSTADVDLSACSAVYAKCLEISELQERVQNHEKVMIELYELLDCCKDTLIPRVMELCSMYNGIQNSKITTTTTTHSSSTSRGEDVVLQRSDADSAMLVVRPFTNEEKGDGDGISATIGGEVLQSIAPPPCSDQSDWEDWGEEDEVANNNLRGGKGDDGTDNEDRSKVVVAVPHKKEAVAIDDGGGRLCDDDFSSSDILNRICDTIAVTSHEDVLKYVVEANEMLIEIARTLDIIPLLYQEGSVMYLHLINKVVPSLCEKMSSIAIALNECGFMGGHERIDVCFWQWSIDCIHSLQQQLHHDNMADLERCTAASAETGGPQLDILKQAASELNCNEGDIPLKIQELIKLNTELYEMREKYLKDEQNHHHPLREPSTACSDGSKTQKFPCADDAAEVMHVEEPSEPWQSNNVYHQSIPDHQGLHVETEDQERDKTALMSSERQIVAEDIHHVLPVQKKSNEGELNVMEDEGKDADDIIVCLMEKLSCTEPSVLLLAVESLQKEHAEVEASSERLWQTAIQAFHVVYVALMDAAGSNEDPDAMLLQQRCLNQVEEAISASSWHGGRAAVNESLNLLNSVAVELRVKAMSLKVISISHTSEVPLVQEDITNSRNLDSRTKPQILSQAFHRWEHLSLHARLRSVREACQQEITVARKEAEDWVTSHFNFENFPPLELQGLELVLPEDVLLAAEEQEQEQSSSSVSLKQQQHEVCEESWDKVNCSIKNIAYEVYRAWSDSSIFVSPRPHSASILELESLLQKAEHERDAQSQDLARARSSVSDMQEENYKLHRDLDEMYERLQSICSNQQPPGPESGDVVGNTNEENLYGITRSVKSSSSKMLDSSISKSQPTVTDSVLKDTQTIQEVVGRTTAVHRFWRQAAIDIFLVSVYLTVISYGYDC